MGDYREFEHAMQEDFDDGFDNEEMEAMMEMEAGFAEPQKPSDTAARRLTFGSTPSKSQTETQAKTSQIAVSSPASNVATFGDSVSPRISNNSAVQSQSSNQLDPELTQPPPNVELSAADLERKRKREREFESLFDEISVCEESKEEKEESSPKRPRLGALENFLLSEPPLSGDFVSITDDVGDRKYLALRDSREVARQVESVSQSQSMSQLRGTLLNTPVRQLLEQLERNELERERKLLSDEHKIEDTQPEDYDHSKNAELWVEKYTPKTFLELLSDSQTNRGVLQWLKQWDLTVFGQKRTGKSRREQKRAEQRGSAPVFNGSGLLAPKPKKQNFGQAVQDTRPEQKVLLLAGPPGTGKTTLAHVVAYHCGYNVVEINASDERSSKMLRERLITATQMKSVFGDRKPNLIILDEIDGVDGSQRGETGGAISELVKIVQASSGDSGDQKKKKRTDVRLTRPIICICNDLYSRSLRSLREVAKVFTLRAPSSVSLCKRMQSICIKEKMRADLRILGELARLTEMDIRSCLNTLQFLRKRSTKAAPHRMHTKLTEHMLSSLTIGHKDMTKGFFEVLGAVFRIEDTKKRKRGVTNSANSARQISNLHQMSGIPQNSSVPMPQSAASVPYEWLRMCNMIRSCDMRRVVMGVHENYPACGYSDPSLDKTLDLTEWMSNADLFLRYQQRTQRFVISNYIPYACIVAKISCATSTFFRPKYPKKDFEVRQKLSQNLATVEKFLSGSNSSGGSKSLVPSASSSLAMHRFNTPTVAVLDLVPQLLGIISPKLKSVPIHQMDDKHKMILAHLVDTMLSCNLQLVPGNFNERKLDPPIDQLVRFEDKPVVEETSFHNSYIKPVMPLVQAAPGNSKALTSIRYDIPSQVKDIIAHEMNLEVMRRADKQKRHELRQQQSGGVFGGKNKSGAAPFMSPARARGSRAPPCTPIPQTQAGNGMFGVKKKKHTLGSPSPSRGTTFMANIKAKSIARVHYPIHFKYVEGHTLAVRRKVFVRDFLPDS
eukprot:845165_1